MKSNDGLASAGGLLSQVAAAQLVGCSRDTIVRARRSGRLPNARLDDGRWMIPVDDLRAAGLSAPIEDQDGAGSTVLEGSMPAEVVVESAAIELARAQARIVGLEDVVARQDEELRFLRLTVEKLATPGAT